MQRWVHTPRRRSHKAAQTPQPWAGHGQQRPAVPSIAKAIPISGWWPWHHSLAWGSLAMRILLRSIEFGCQERASTSFSGYKDNGQAAPSVALGFGQGFALGIPSRQTCYVPNLGAGKGKREFLHSTRPAKGLLSSTCSLQGIRCLSPSGGRGRTEYKALCDKWYLCHTSHQVISSPFRHLFPSLQLPSNPSS